MRYGVISDIHSNLEALEAIFDEIDSIGVDKTICLGDIVGYNANPNECIDILRKRGVESVMGNHDSRAAELEEPSDFNPLAATAVIWTREVLTETNKSYLSRLPRSLKIDETFLAVHGWINDTDRYIQNTDDAEANFELLWDCSPLTPIKICFFGHTHIARSFIKDDNEVREARERRISIESKRLYLVNPGSVGQPRDLDPRASFAVFDSEKSEINMYRVEYDIESCSKKVLKAGLPKLLAERIKLGR